MNFAWQLEKKLIEFVAHLEIVRHVWAHICLYGKQRLDTNNGQLTLFFSHSEEPSTYVISIFLLPLPHSPYLVCQWLFAHQEVSGRVKQTTSRRDWSVTYQISALV